MDNQELVNKFKLYEDRIIHLEKELNETDGVKTATVDFDKKLATVEFDTNIQTPDKLVQIVQKTGDGQTYKVSNVK